MSGPTYFVDHKRGEVNELKLLLSNPKIDREPDKKRDVIKKVIAYMTLGIDVSRLFSEMVMAASTKDLVSKKMVYHYLSTYARVKADLAVLVINTIQKDCRDEDPMVRGLALRALCALRLPNLAEYVMPPLRAGLSDSNPYVRKTAVVGVAKVICSFPSSSLVPSSDLVDTLYNMLRDKDTLVITNAIQALNQILYNEGGMAVNTPLILYLLNRIKEFSEWGQCVLLDLVATYKPSSENELFDIMNLLEDRLRHANSAVVLATTKVFLNFTKDNKPVHEQVYKRLKAPLITMVGSNSMELGFAVLSHIQLLCERAPGVFNDEYKHFFARYNDPSCVKLLKLQVLTLLADRHNFGEILNEMSEYVTDVDPDIARAVIRAVGKIAISNNINTNNNSSPTALLDDCIEHLLSFLDLNTDYVSAETVVVISDILRKYPERHSDLVTPCVSKCLRMFEHIFDDRIAAISFVWILGEYGEYIDDSPYILDNLFLSRYKELTDDPLKSELLTATMKLFFKRPPEIKGMLGKLLSTAISTEIEKVDVHDLALMYYRLLKLDVHEAARVVNCPKVIVDVFAETVDPETKEKIFKEFNTLSIIYNNPSDRFIKKRSELENENDQNSLPTNDSHETQKFEAPDADYPDEDTTNSHVNNNNIISTPTNNSNPVQGALVSNGNGSSDLLGTDLLGSFDSLGLTGTATVSSVGPTLNLIAGSTVDKATYQSKWGALSVSERLELIIVNPAVNAKLIESKLQQISIFTFASGQVGSVFKLYLFARDSSNLFLIESIIDVTTGKLTATIKVDGSQGSGAELASGLANLFRQALKPLC